MSIKLTYNNDRIYINMPYGYKDDFRMVFAGSKWHPAVKAWSVSEEDESALLAWIEEAPARAERTQADGIQRQVETIDEQTKTIALTRIDEMKAKERAAASLATLKAMKDELACVEAEAACERKEREEHEAEIIAKLSPILDYEALRQAAATMARFEASTATNDEKAWQNAQDVLIDARNVLRNANLSIEAVDFLANLRHGRASVRGMPPGAWYGITKY